VPRERPGVIAAKGAGPARLKAGGRAMNRSGAWLGEMSAAPFGNEGGRALRPPG
jgi:hypothetical protein